MQTGNNSQHNEVRWLAANWPAPAHVHAGTTLRNGGISSPPYDQLNLGLHVNDNSDHVLKNRAHLTSYLKLPSEPVRLNQVHENNIIQIDSQEDFELTDKTADGCYSTKTDNVCVVMSADCLPLLLCDNEGTQIAAVHIGWRGFSKDIIAKALEKFTCHDKNILAWILHLR